MPFLCPRFVEDWLVNIGENFYFFSCLLLSSGPTWIWISSSDGCCHNCVFQNASTYIPTLGVTEMILMCGLKNHHKLGKQKHTGVLGDLAQSFSRCLCLVCTYNFSYAHGHHQPTTCAPENDQENHEIASFKKHSCFENRIPKINNVFPKTAVTFLEAGTLNAPRNHQENIKSVPREQKTHTWAKWSKESRQTK